MVHHSSIHLKTYGIFVGISVALARCLWSVQCPCGTSNTSFSFCLDVATRHNDTCARWANCATCRRDSNECLSCPEGRFGTLCDQIDSLGNELSTSDFPRKIQRQNETAWSNSIHSKRVRKRSSAFMLSCPDPGEVEHATASEFYAKKRGFFPGEKLGYVCRPGYDLVGEAVLRCLNNSRWSAEVPECRYLRTVSIIAGTSCSDPGEVRNADVIRRPQEAMFSCHRGYVRFGASVLRCVHPDRWDGELPLCFKTRRRPVVVETPANTDTLELSECLDPGQVEKAERYTDGFPENTFFYTISYACASGYTVVGASVIKCLGNDSWSSEKPKCEIPALTNDENISEEYDDDYYSDEIPVRYCKSPGQIDNGYWEILSFNGDGVRPSVNDAQFPERTRIKFFCDDAYSMAGGFSTVHCLHTGYWSSGAPFCNLVSDCGYSTLHSLKKVHRGVKTEPGEWPWTVAISKISGRFSRLSCGGSLLDNRTVLTAAHCLMNPNLEDTADVRLYFGKYNRSDVRDDDQVITRMPSMFMIHPKYDPETKDNDIALIRVEPPVRYSSRIRPVCLPTRETSYENLQPDRSGFVVGWGTTEKNLESAELMMALVPVVPGPQCMLESKRQNISMLITRNMFCAGFPEGHVASCTGDSGGPLVFHDPQTDRHTIEGLVSFGRYMECGMAHRYTVYTEVSRYIPWISRSVAAMSGQNEVTRYCLIPRPLDYLGDVKVNVTNVYVVSGGKRIDSINTDSIDDEFPLNTTLEFTCREGYYHRGSPTLQCSARFLFWSGVVPLCYLRCVRSVSPFRGVKLWDYPCEPPWFVYLRIANNSEETPGWECPGALLDDTTVLTAGNCLLRNNVLAKEITLSFGNYSVTRKSSRIIPHYQYNAATNESDIGIILFSPPITLSKRIKPIDLSSARNLQQVGKGYVLGLWRSWSSSTYLIAGYVLDATECDSTFAKGNVSMRNADKVFCAGFHSADYNVKPGGLFVFYDAMSDGILLEGLASFRITYSRGSSMVFTKVSRFRSWIEEQMGT